MILFAICFIVVIFCMLVPKISLTLALDYHCSKSISKLIDISNWTHWNLNPPLDIIGVTFPIYIVFYQFKTLDLEQLGDKFRRSIRLCDIVSRPKFKRVVVFFLKRKFFGKICLNDNFWTKCRVVMRPRFFCMSVRVVQDFIFH